MPAALSCVTGPCLFSRCVHIVVFALGSLCAGCQTLDHTEPRFERTPRLVAGLAYTTSPGPVARVSDLPPYNGDDVWQRLARRCALADGQGNERIARQRDWLLSNRGFLRGASERASPYLHFIVERLDERKMPLELALLPMIESAYNPMANSPRAAAGLWQFIPSTGRDFNLPQNASYDARRDVVASSKAAMDYLTRLHGQFNNDWLLALAAYNAGEGTVGRAIEANLRRGLPADYWHLTLPRETQDYVPRLLALSLLVRDPYAYGVQLTPVANTPYFEVVELNQAVDLKRLAATAGIDERALLSLNAAFVRNKTLDGPGRLLVPMAQKQLLAASIARMNDGMSLPAVAVQGPGGIASEFNERPVPSTTPVPSATPVPIRVAVPGPAPIERKAHDSRRVVHALPTSPRVVVYASDP